ncbi:MAG: bifunctional acetate--CoA ligase family protein/GNAT family N-acetyltransferase [Motiliproteus sp.]
MRVSDLDSLFRPTSITIVGASERPDSMGSAVMQNLLHGHFSGPILPINPTARSVFGVYCYDSVATLPLIPELAVLCTPPSVTPDLVRQLGEAGTRVAIVITMDPDRGPGNETTAFKQQLLDAASPSGIRLLGPGSTGIQVPALRLNASWIMTASRPGKVALVSQSGSFAAGLAEWAHTHNLGLSHVVSTGDAVDIDVEEILDYLGTRDPLVRSVLLYIRSVQNARRFMSAARAIARSKTVIAISNGQQSVNQQETISRDSIYDAAIRRAGMLRVFNTDEVFDAVETLSYMQQRRSGKLAILSNGFGPGEAAVQVISRGEGKVISLSEEAVSALQQLSPWVTLNRNLVSIGRDADANRYRDALAILVKDKQIDALLVMHTPTSVAEGGEVADALIEVAKKSSKNILACWIGQDKKEAIHNKLSAAGIALLSTPDKAARAFLHLVHFQRNQQMLLEAPSAIPEGGKESRDHAHRLIEQQLAAGQHLLNEEISAMLLRSYGLAVADTRVATGVSGILEAAQSLSYPMALRRCSKSVMRSADIAKLALDLFTKEALEAAAVDMDCEDQAGFIVQAMTPRSGQYVLQVSIDTDREFGPVISLGIGGSSAHTNAARATALPPLNMTLAAELVDRSRVLQLLGGDISKDQLCQALVNLSQLITDFPEIKKMEINPLLAGPQGVTALEARTGLWNRSAEQGLRPGMAIRPYPRELEREAELRQGQRILIRPVRPEDEQAYQDFFKQVAPNDMYLRFFRNISELPSADLAKMIQIDYDREMAFTAFSLEPDAASPQLLGEVRTSTLPDNGIAEYSILLRQDMKGSGLGRRLMEMIIDYTRQRGTDKIVGTVLVQNTGMLRLCEKLGFTSHFNEDDEDIYEMELELQSEKR